MTPASSEDWSRLAELVRAVADELDLMALRSQESVVAATQPLQQSEQISKRLWFSTSQAADYLGFHRDTVMKACESGELHASQRVPKGRWRIRLDDLNVWAQR